MKSCDFKIIADNKELISFSIFNIDLQQDYLLTLNNNLRYRYLGENFSFDCCINILKKDELINQNKLGIAYKNNTLWLSIDKKGTAYITENKGKKYYIIRKIISKDFIAKVEFQLSSLLFKQWLKPYGVSVINKTTLSNKPKGKVSEQKNIDRETKKFQTIKKAKDSTNYDQLNGYDIIILVSVRSCINKAHDLIEVDANIPIIIDNGMVNYVSMPILYCEQCNQYYAYKTDFFKLKEYGTIMCRVDDCRKYEKGINNNFRYGGESFLHQMGYNVSAISNYTDEKRKTILANVIENTTMQKEDIRSLININIARHGNQKNYKTAVQKWEKDIMYLSNYKKGDYASVLPNRIKIGISAPNTTELTVFSQITSLIAGNYVTKNNSNRITISTKDVPSDTDFCVRVPDNSMEPTILNNELLFIKKTSKLRNGDIGVFLLCGESKCKEYHIDNNGLITLVSHNSRYDNIKVNQAICVIQGKVVGHSSFV